MNRAFDQNIATWDVRKVTSMYEMSFNATSFNQNIATIISPQAPARPTNQAVVDAARRPEAQHALQPHIPDKQNRMIGIRVLKIHSLR